MPLSLFVVVPPGLEGGLVDELEEIGYHDLDQTPGGVALTGGWEDVAAINVRSAMAARVLVRLGTFRAHGLRDLERRAARLDWRGLLQPGTPVRVKVTCKKSRIYHTGAAEERLRRAMNEAAGGTVEVASADAEVAEAPETLTVMLRIERDRATVSVDTSGEHLHRRGYRQQVARAPLRETLAAAMLRQARWRVTEPLVDPMCGSGTLLIEAARRAAGIPPGVDRNFAFESWGVVDAAVLRRLRRRDPAAEAGAAIVGSDRDAGAIDAAISNAERAGVADRIALSCQALSHAAAPPGGPGLILTNPPWGGRVGANRDLRNLYARLGQLLNGPFEGWRLAFLTPNHSLANAAGPRPRSLGDSFEAGGTRVRLYGVRSGTRRLSRP